jgi:hypothetical protein
MPFTSKYIIIKLLLKAAKNSTAVPILNTSK